MIYHIISNLWMLLKEERKVFWIMDLDKLKKKSKLHLFIYILIYY